jgi:NDP-sugar pyrophosphorylase family protein
MDIGRISSYLNINKFLLDKRKVKYLYGENSKIYGKLDYCSIGDNVIINKNSNLKSVVVYDNSKINEGSILENCVVGENCIIGKDSILNNVVVGDGETISENSNLENEIIWNKSIPDGYPKKQIGNVIKK